jgi:hypothetical protein
MKPNDANGKLPPDDRPYRVLLLAGSDRRQYDCPGIDSKARAWPCNCYKKGSRGQPDLMWNLDMYSRLDLADGRTSLPMRTRYSRSS